jgi:hypothetical protein
MVLHYHNFVCCSIDMHVIFCNSAVRCREKGHAGREGREAASGRGKISGKVIRSILIIIL